MWLSWMMLDYNSYIIDTSETEEIERHCSIILKYNKTIKESTVCGLINDITLNGSLRITFIGILPH